jgi:hypothetical protein
MEMKKFVRAGTNSRLETGRGGRMLSAMKEKWKSALPFLFVALLGVSRWPGLLPWSFSAVYAFVFCSGVYFPRRVSWWLPLVVMLGTDVALNCYYQHKDPSNDVWSAANLANLAFNYAAYLALIFLGRRFKPQSSFFALLGGGLLGAVLFYLITNTASWLFNPEYTKTLAGWIIALTKGVSGWPTTLEFFRNTLLSSGLFTALFVGAAKLTVPAESPADKTAGARADEPEPEEAPEEARA